MLLTITSGALFIGRAKHNMLSEIWTQTKTTLNRGIGKQEGLTGMTYTHTFMLV